MRTQPRLSNLLLVASLATLLCAGSATAQSCFYPDGSDADGLSFERCGGDNTTFSATCCDIERGDRCLRNGLCSYQGNYDYRGACASDNWNNCQEICPDIHGGNWTQVRECAANEFCCVLHEDRDCCTNDADRFSLSAPDPSSSGGGGSPGEPETSGGDDDGLSSGTIGGIAGAVGGAALAGAGLGVWWFLRRRKRQKARVAAAAAAAAGGDASMSPSSQAATVTLNGTPFEGDRKLSPAGGAELPTSGNVAEMDGSDGRVEADSRPVIAESDAGVVERPKVFHEMPA